MATSDSPLSVPNITLAVAKQGGAVSPPPGGDQTPDLSLPAGNIVSDQFDSADTSAPGYPDFDWHSNNSTSIVTMDPNLAHCVGTGPYAVYNNGDICNPDTDTTKDWQALIGDYCMRFRYAAGTNTSVFAERRWRLMNGRVEPTLWARWALRVPVNFYHDGDLPGSVTSNNKLFYFWMDEYVTSRTGTIVGAEFRPDGSGGSTFYPASGGPLATSRPFISVPEDRGRWMYLAVKLVAESSPGAADGSIELWRKWAESGSAWVKEFEVLNKAFNLPTDGTKQGWAAGYLMGADNSGYAEETEFFVDDFNLSTESLL